MECVFNFAILYSNTSEPVWENCNTDAPRKHMVLAKSPKLLLVFTRSEKWKNWKAKNAHTLNSLP